MRRIRRAGRALAIAVLLGVFALAPGIGAAPVAQAAATDTVVSLTFDDGDADQLAAARLLQRYRFHGTFYVISGSLGQPGYLDRAQLGRIAGAGNEIGAHTVSHLNLTQVSAAEARRQACSSRAQLTSWGFPVASMAYPNGATDPAVEGIVRACGYSSARLGAELRAPGGCTLCPVAEQIPPRDPYAIRTPGNVNSSWTLADLQNEVTATERSGGGWVPLVFHHVCDGRCGELSVRPPVLEAFLAWLAGREPSGTVVRTVSQVAVDEHRPIVRAAPASGHRLVNPSLEQRVRNPRTKTATEAAEDPDTPTCWQAGGYGHNTARWQRTTSGLGGGHAERLSLTGYASGDAKLLQRLDLGECSLPVHAGGSYRLGAWYRSSAPAQFAVYVRNSSGSWRYWTSGPYLEASSDWQHAQWRTPPVPEDARGLSFGLALFSAGHLTTDGYSFAPAPRGAAASGYGVDLGAGLGVGAAIAALAALLIGERRWRRKPAGGRYRRPLRSRLAYNRNTRSRSPM